MNVLECKPRLFTSCDKYTYPKPWDKAVSAPCSTHSALVTESDESKHTFFLRYTGKEFGGNLRILCLLSPLPASPPECQALHISAARHSRWNANLSPANLGCHTTNRPYWLHWLYFRYLQYRQTSLIYFLKSSRVGISVSGLGAGGGGDNGEMFVAAICNHLMLTESGILFSN